MGNQGNQQNPNADDDERRLSRLPFHPAFSSIFTDNGSFASII
jgi:hypothetical protein